MATRLSCCWASRPCTGLLADQQLPPVAGLARWTGPPVGRCSPLQFVALRCWQRAEWPLAPRVRWPLRARAPPPIELLAAAPSAARALAWLRALPLPLLCSTCATALAAYAGRMALFGCF